MINFMEIMTTIEEYIYYVSLSDLAKLGLHAISVILLAFIINLVFGMFFRRALKRADKDKNVNERRTKKTRIQFMYTVVSNSIFVLAIIIILFAVPGFRTFSVSILAGAGIAAVVVGFAAQKTLANIIAGISIAFYTPFRIGDRLEINGESGYVNKINLRHTVIRTWDNRRVIIPNSIISEREIVNYSLDDSKVCKKINVSVSYDSDIDKAQKIMLDIADKHKDVLKKTEIKNDDGKMQEEGTHIRVIKFDDYSINLRLYVWIEKDSRGYRIRSEIYQKILKEFAKEGIEIPFPYRTIVYKKDIDAKKK